MRVNTQAKIQSKVPQRCESQLSTFVLLSVNKLLKIIEIYACVWVDIQEREGIELSKFQILCLY